MTAARETGPAQAYAGEDWVKPPKDDPWKGTLLTPINDSPLARAFIRNLPAYRPGVSPFMRGLEIGMAHGYFLVGPQVIVGPLRETAHGANLSGLITAIYVSVSAVLGISLFALTMFQGDPSRGAYNSHSKDDLRPLRKKEDWFELGGGILLGAMGGAIFAYLLLENFSDLDSILRGGVNVSQLLPWVTG